MNSAFGKHIFDETGTPTREVMEKYLEGTLSPQEMHAVEAQLANDPFAADAAEGLAATPGALTGMSALQSRFEASQGATAGAGTTASKGFWAANKSWISGAGLMIAGGITTVILLNIFEEKPTPEPQEIADTTPRNTPQQEMRSIPFTYVMEEMTDSAIDVAEELPQEEQVTALVAQANQSEMEQPEVIEPVAPQQRTPVAEVLDTMENLQPKEVEQPQRKRIKSNVATTTINDLKVVDYSQFYKGKIELSRFDHGQGINHLEAKYETEKRKSEDLADPDIIVTYIPYMDFLTRAMNKFDKSDFKGALKDFKTILKFFPEDANAHFYGALCYYNIREYKKAINHFEMAATNSANTFHQEARWYEAKTHIKRGRDHKARPILKEIIDFDGFYAPQASQLLEKIGPGEEDQ